MTAFTKHIVTAYISTAYLKCYNKNLPATKEGYEYCIIVHCKRCKLILRDTIAVVIHGNRNSSRSRHMCIDCFLLTRGKRTTKALLRRELNKRKGKGKWYKIKVMLFKALQYVETTA